MKREINDKIRRAGIALEKLGKKAKKAVWLDISGKIMAPVRKRAEVNVYELEELAKSNSGKILVVPGKVIASGDAKSKIEVACMNCSKSARQKIENAGGKIMTIEELCEAKPAASKMVIIQ